MACMSSGTPPAPPVATPTGARSTSTTSPPSSLRWPTAWTSTKEITMAESRYTRLVRAHWEQFRPRELAQMPDPDAFLAHKEQELHEALIEAQETLERSLP